jgi:DNA polymerase-3 subunit epsilon
MRQIVLDTETTGIDPKQGHRIVEIGAVELDNRRPTGRTYHQYINPDRHIDDEVIRIHGITNERVANEPYFEAIVSDFMAFIEGAELLIHNAPFDIGHLNAELARLKPNPWGKIEQHASVTDTLALSKKQYPGQRHSLDALCKRLGVDNSKREFHGALLDSQILADVYLAMTGGQTGLGLSHETNTNGGTQSKAAELAHSLLTKLPLFVPSNEQQQAHQTMIARMEKKACIWTTGYAG